MANDTPMALYGNLVEDPILRYTASGVAVANVAIATTPRRFNKQTNDWEDQTAMFLRGSVWRDYAENVTESLHKGDRVMVIANLVQRDYETKEGEKRHSIELEIMEIGPALRYATATVKRNERKGGGGTNNGYSPDDVPFNDNEPSEPPF